MIAAIDHVVPTTSDEKACLRFHVDVLGMRVETFGAGPRRHGIGRLSRQARSAASSPR